MGKAIKVPSPPRGLCEEEKLLFYDKLIEQGLDAEQLKIVRNRLYKIDTDWLPVEAYILKQQMLLCIKEILAEEAK